MFITRRFVHTDDGYLQWHGNTRQDPRTITLFRSVVPWLWLLTDVSSTPMTDIFSGTGTHDQTRERLHLSLIHISWAQYYQKLTPPVERASDNDPYDFDIHYVSQLFAHTQLFNINNCAFYKENKSPRIIQIEKYWLLAELRGETK